MQFDTRRQGQVKLTAFQRLWNLQNLCLHLDKKDDLSWSTDCTMPNLAHLEVHDVHLRLKNSDKFPVFFPSAKKLVVAVSSETYFDI